MIERYRHVMYATLSMLSVIIFGTVGFYLTEGISTFDALWLTAITVLTVGYGDAVPRTEAGKIFALFIIPMGIGIVTYAIGAVTALILEGELSRSLRRKKMVSQIEHLQGHIIVCGFGRVGRQVYNQLHIENQSVVVIENNQDVLETMDEDILYVNGDARINEVLVRAGIERATGLIATLPTDADNVFVSLSAKEFNQDLHIVARAAYLESENKLKRAGADVVINPTSISGRRMAMSILKPKSAEYVETIFVNNRTKLDIEELILSHQSSFINKSIAENKIRDQYGVTILAVQKGEKVLHNPSAELVLKEKDIIFVFGEREDIKKLEMDA
ncbi:NAD-binding protein [Bacillus carboniphilus]|uniref:NAD-binding protein n=1 Tax=Bacillus carboniphilus TaxID=86663 RepID=A0ABY9JVU2_9BACI|nr:potassium channel protein [Bacillus carboniphilus]WLR41765.1 NAD-binding protein [Bacillus carboniphilus]